MDGISSCNLVYQGFLVSQIGFLDCFRDKIPVLLQLFSDVQYIPTLALPDLIATHLITRVAKWQVHITEHIGATRIKDCESGNIPF